MKSLIIAMLFVTLFAGLASAQGQEDNNQMALEDMVKAFEARHSTTIRYATTGGTETIITFSTDRDTTVTMSNFNRSGKYESSSPVYLTMGCRLEFTLAASGNGYDIVITRDGKEIKTADGYTIGGFDFSKFYIVHFESLYTQGAVAIIAKTRHANNSRYVTATLAPVAESSLLNLIEDQSLLSSQ